MKNYLLMLVVLITAGCATQPTSTSQAQMAPAKQILNADLVKQSSGTGEVVVKRDSGIRGAACSIRIFADATPIADLWQGEKVVFYLTPGDHILSASTCGGGMVEIQTNVKVEKASTYRVGFGVVSELGIFPTAF